MNPLDLEADLEEPNGFPRAISVSSELDDGVLSEIESRMAPMEQKKASWRLFRRRKQNSNSSLVSRKSLFPISRRRKVKKKPVSGLFLAPVSPSEQFMKTQALASTQRTKSLSSEGKRSRVTNRVRSNSSFKTKGRRYRRKLEQEERERNDFLKFQMTKIVKELCVALGDKDRDLFLSLFIDKAQICHPVGILKEYDISRYFDNFVQVYSKMDAQVDQNATIMDLRHKGIHCDVLVSSQYMNGNADYIEPQHWHFDVELIMVDPRCGSDDEPEVETLPRSDSRIKSKGSLDFFEVERSLKLVIKRWHVYSSLSRYKVKNRSYSDIFNSSVTWLSYGRKYGRGFVTSQLSAAFNTEGEPRELTNFLDGLRSYNLDEVQACISSALRAAVIEGFCSYYIAAEANRKANTLELVQVLLKQFSKVDMRQIKCESSFRCGDRISARLTITSKRSHFCAFLLLRMTGDKKSAASNKIKEILLCTEYI